MRSRKPKMLALGCALTFSVILASCASQTNSSAKIDLKTTKVACEAFEPITWSPKDTDTTILEVKQHNAAWKAVCKGQP